MSQVPPGSPQGQSQQRPHGQAPGRPAQGQGHPPRQRPAGQPSGQQASTAQLAQAAGEGGVHGAVPRGRSRGGDGGGGGWLNFDILAYAKPVAWPVLLVGLLLIIGSRGCSNLASLNVKRANAKLNLAVTEFQAEKNEALDDIRDRLQDAEDREVRDSLQEDLRKAQDKWEDDEKKREKDEWKELRRSANRAAADANMARYWHEMVFVLGTVLLMGGLVVVGATGVGAERWIALIMIAIITFSIFVVGWAWSSTIDMPSMPRVSSL